MCRNQHYRTQHIHINFLISFNHSEAPRQQTIESFANKESKSIQLVEHRKTSNHFHCHIDSTLKSI